MQQPKVILVIMDGWGFSNANDGNAINLAQKPNFNYFWQNYPHTLLSASGEEVGLPWGAMGSSEVGHLTIGSGRVIYQDLPRVTRAISDGTFYNNENFNKAIDHAIKNHSCLHLAGLVSAGGVHSHIIHIQSLLKLLKKRNFKGESYLHVFTDGRDTPPQSALTYISKIKQTIKDLGLKTQIATVSGRYYAMDRDSHWDRTNIAYLAMVDQKGLTANSPEEAINNSYQNNETDEFIKPTIINNPVKKNFFPTLHKKSDTSNGGIQDNDAVIFFNFRPDRMRQIVETFLFPREDIPDKTLRKNLFIVTMTEYNQELPVNSAFPPEKITSTLSQIISDNHLHQLHVAETEKYAHVTYFFNGGHAETHTNETWNLIPSPKVSTYDQKPEMSANEITDYLITQNARTPFDFILINYANADMVGHTGNLEQTIKAVEVVDAQLGRLKENFPDSFIVITADHGNAEVMINPKTKEIDTEHSINPVPLLLVNEKIRLSKPQSSINAANGILADIAPTVLSILNLPQPEEMTGYNLLNSLAPQYQVMYNQKTPIY